MACDRRYQKNVNAFSGSPYRSPAKAYKDFLKQVNLHAGDECKDDGKCVEPQTCKPVIVDAPAERDVVKPYFNRKGRLRYCIDYAGGPITFKCRCIVDDYDDDDD